MSREYARRSRGGGNLPLIIAIVGTIIVIAVIAYFLLGSDGTSIFGGGGTPTPAPATFTPIPANTPTPGPTPAPTPAPTIEVVLQSESPEAVIVTATPTPAPAKTFLDATIAATSLNVREGPGMDYGKIGKARYGERYKVYDETTSWVKIMLPNGVYGWIWKKSGYVVRGNDALPPKPTSEPEPSWLSSATLSGSTLTVKFSKGVYGNKDHTVSLGTTDFTVKEGSSAISFTLAHTAGSDTATLTLGPTSGGNVTVSIASDTIFDVNGDASPSGSKTTGGSSDTTAPTVSMSNSSNVVTASFSETVYANNDGTGTISSSAFGISGTNGATVTFNSVSHNGSTVTIDLNISGLSSGTSSTITVVLQSSSAYDAAGNACSSSTYNFTYTEP